MGVDDDPAAMRRRAMADPDVQAIMSDPGMREILNQMREDPAAGRECVYSGGESAGRDGTGRDGTGRDSVVGGQTD